MGELVFQDIRVVWDEHTLAFSNSGYSRTVSLASPVPHTLEMKDGSGRIFASENTLSYDADFYGLTGKSEQKKWHLETFNAAVMKDLPFESDHVLVTLRYFDDFSHARLTREFFLYPGVGMYGVRNKIKTPVLPDCSVPCRPGLREEYIRFAAAHGNDIRFNKEPVVEILHPAQGFKPVAAVEFAGHTDVHDTPVREHKLAPGNDLYTGNLLFCEDETEAGFMILQEAPPSTERREKESFDFRLSGNGDIISLGWGFTMEELIQNETFVSYRNAVGIYHNAEEKDRLLKEYCRARFNYGKEYYGVVCNAWGCGRFGEFLNPRFLADEVKGAAECGADSYQVDDQWQFGNLGDLMVRCKDVVLREFWNINPEKVENGSFDSLMELARKCGIKLALWIAPSFSKSYQDYEEFTELLLDFHRRYGFELFKVDGAYFSSYRAEQNFEKLLKNTALASGKKIFFNLDVTAGMRGGYFKLLEYGNLFLENRYACHNWGMGYHPLRTLRNAWNLAKYVRLQYLQLEVPYCGDVLDEFYISRNETNPNVYPWEFWFAVSFFGNPLLWFAPSTVKPEYRAVSAKMIGLHKKYREEIFAGVISPVGDEPGADALSGLVSRRDGKEQFMVLFRGHEAEKSAFATDCSWELLAGKAEFADGKVIIPEKASYAILKRK
ncbi:MAG: hypothetical protein E7048_09375 [Lentisphaerae bacterium]|nr:hypothetical protein [Lentisphaerota bacterium]